MPLRGGNVCHSCLDNCHSGVVFPTTLEFLTLGWYLYHSRLVILTFHSGVVKYTTPMNCSSCLCGHVWHCDLAVFTVPVWQCVPLRT